MIMRRWFRLVLLAFLGAASMGVLALAPAAGAKVKKATFNRCVNAAVTIPDGPATGTAPNPAASFALRVKVPKFRGRNQNGVITSFHAAGVRISHTDDGDLALFLVSPGGRAVALSTYRDDSADKSGDGYGSGPLNCTGSIVQFGDQFPSSVAKPGNTGNGAPITGTFTPEQPLSTFVGGPARGFWTLIVQDIQPTDIGQINALSLNFTYRYRK
jgi:hypothetical protein